MTAKLVVRVAEGEVEKATALLEEAFELGLNLADGFNEFFRVVVKDSATTGAGELTTWVGFEPTERLLNLLAAGRARADG